jgi:Fe-S cluster biogenesis protein NfuA
LSAVERVEAVLAGLRAGFQADGADLRVLDVDGGRAVIRIVALEETCWDCIVGPAMLQVIIETAVREALPEIGQVVLEDPRAQRRGGALDVHAGCP